MDSPELLQPDDVVESSRYELVRPRYRELVARLRDERRLRLGDTAVLLFENRETVLWQVHEVLRCEGATSARIARVLADYAPILPPPGQLRATLMIDGADVGVATAMGHMLRGDGGLVLRCGTSNCCSTPASPPSGAADRVWYLRWQPSPSWCERLRSDDVALSVRPRWSSLAVLVPATTRRQLIDDLDRRDPATPALLHALARHRVRRAGRRAARHRRGDGGQVARS